MNVTTSNELLEAVEAVRSEPEGSLERTEHLEYLAALLSAGNVRVVLVEPEEGEAATAAELTKHLDHVEGYLDYADEGRDSAVRTTVLACEVS